MKNQTLVLRELFEAGRKLDVLEIMKKTKLKRSQVYTALIDLDNRYLIKKHRTVLKIGKNNPPHGHIEVEINKKVLDRIKDVIAKEE